MTLKPSRQEIPVNKELSVLDIKALKEFYAPPSKLSSNWYKELSVLDIKALKKYYAPPSYLRMGK